MDWMLPGIPPTGKRVEIPMVVVVQFDGDKMAHEHLYWDQASVLVQLGLLQPGSLPVVGAEAARSVLDRSIPLNALIHRAKTR
jgi:carboxymethylenebutenolidase